MPSDNTLLLGESRTSKFLTPWGQFRQIMLLLAPLENEYPIRAYRLTGGSHSSGLVLLLFVSDCDLITA